MHHSLEKVWRALIDPVLLAEWLLPVVDLKLEPGAAFTFKAQPQPGWDGIVNCRFLEIEFDPEMLNTNNYVDYATGGLWGGLSSYETAAYGISTHRIDRWKKSLAPPIVKTLEFACCPEMELFGYRPSLASGDRWPDPEVLDFILEDNEGYKKWRSDFGIPEHDLGFELFRKMLLASPRTDFDAALIRRSFLFEDVFQKAKQGRSDPADAVALKAAS